MEEYDDIVDFFCFWEVDVCCRVDFETGDICDDGSYTTYTAYD